MIAVLRREAPLIALTVALAALALVAATHLPSAGQNAQADRLIGRLAVAASEQSEIIQQRIKAKDRVLGQLVTEELTLPQAAAWFRFLNDNPPEYPSDFRHHCRGDSDGEKACRHVLAWLGGMCSRRYGPSQADATLCRYEGELEALLRDGAVELPW